MYVITEIHRFIPGYIETTLHLLPPRHRWMSRISWDSICPTLQHEVL